MESLKTLLRLIDTQQEVLIDTLKDTQQEVHEETSDLKKFCSKYLETLLYVNKT